MIQKIIINHHLEVHIVREVEKKKELSDHRGLDWKIEKHSRIQEKNVLLEIYSVRSITGEAKITCVSFVIILSVWLCGTIRLAYAFKARHVKTIPSTLSRILHNP